MSRLLITRPDHDDVTAYLHAWPVKVIEEARNHGVEIFDLRGKRANKKDLESIIIGKQPRLVLFNGHGNEKRIAGYNNDTLILLGHNEKLLERKIVYSVSCSSARELGRKCIDSAKCSAFIGYEEDFAFYYDPNKLSRPLSDTIAAPNLDSSNQAGISLVKGNNANESFRMSQNAFRKWIRKFIGSKELEAPYALQTLIHNMMNQSLHGNGESKFSS